MKKPINPIKNFKKPTSSVRFYKLKQKKRTEPNPNWKKPEKNPSQIGKKLSQNRVKPKKRVKLV